MMRFAPASGAADLRQGADRRHRDERRRPAPARASSAAAGIARGVLGAAEAARGERARVAPGRPAPAARSAGTARGSFDRAAARRRPATSPTTRAGLIAHRRGERLVALLPHEREQPEAHGVRFRRLRPLSSSGAMRRDRALLRRSPTPSGRRPAADPVSPISPSASAARPRTRGSASCSAAVSAGTAVLSASSPSANAAICRTSGSASASSGWSAARSLRQPDAPDRQRGAPADARLGVGDELRQIRRRRPAAEAAAAFFFGFCGGAATTGGGRRLGRSRIR